MKKILLGTICLFTLLFSSQRADAQVSHLIWGASPFQDSLWSIDTTTWSVVNRVAPSLAGFTITGINGLAQDPQTFKIYAILKVSGVSGRVLATMSLPSGVCTPVNGTPSASSLGDNFSSISFRRDGQLFGLTGDGATVPETLYMIDKNTAAKTLQTALGNGADGEILLFNKDDNMFYHWSGNGTVIFEKFPSSAPYTPVTNIPTSGTASGEIFGSLYLSPGNLIVSTISSNFRRFTTGGAYGATLLSLPDDLRGLVFPPSFSISSTTVCEEIDQITISNGNLQLFDTVYYHWGDSNIDTYTATTGSASHTYMAPGTYTVSVLLATTATTPDTITTFTVTVNNIPVVSLSGSTALCPGGNVTLTGSSGGTHQWYLNGTVIPGATTNTYVATAPGVYNMIKTNLNGCGDSAAVGLTVISVPDPVVNLGADTTVCGGITLDAQNSGAIYLWQDSTTTQTYAVSTSGTYEVMVTDSNGCSASDSATITVNANPVVNLGADSSICSGNTLTLDAQNSGATYLWQDSTATQTYAVTASGTYAVTVTDGNGCSGSDSVTITVNQSPTVNIGPDVTQCGGSVMLDAGAGFASYLWCNASTGQTIILTSSGTCEVTVADSNGCSASDTINVTINPNPTVGLSIAVSNICVDDANVTLVGTPSGGTFSGTSVTGNQFDPSVGAGSHDVYYSFTDANGCSGMDTLSITVSACVGITELASNMLSIYPNPGSGLFTIELPVADAAIVVTDMLGKEVLRQQANASGKQLLDLSMQAEGVYYVRVSAGDQTSVARLIIKK